jgi:hypothetical protein
VGRQQVAENFISISMLDHPIHRAAAHVLARSESMGHTIWLLPGADSCPPENVRRSCWCSLDRSTDSSSVHLCGPTEPSQADWCIGNLAACNRSHLVLLGDRTWRCGECQNLCRALRKLTRKTWLSHRLERTSQLRSSYFTTSVWFPLQASARDPQVKTLSGVVPQSGIRLVPVTVPV